MDGEESISETREREDNHVKRESNQQKTRTQ